jgi:undecaprenyl-diphosphatase
MEWLTKILELDTQLFLYLNQFHSDFWDTIMLLVTRKETWFPFYLLIIYFIIKNYRNKSIFILLFLTLAIVASDQLSVLLKESIQRLRPVHEPGIQHLVHNVLRKGGLYGFVSSHAANSFAIFVFLSRVFKKRSVWFLFMFWAVIVSYSRIYSGVHYPLDIFGGAILGWILAVIFFKLLMFVENHFFIARSPRIEKTTLANSQSYVLYLTFAVLMSSLFIAVYILHHYNYL